MTFLAAANTLTYEGGLGADSLIIDKRVNSSTIYGDNASATTGGDDSISIGGSASGSWIYANEGDDSVRVGWQCICQHCLPKYR